MKCESFQQFAIVAADSAQSLTDQLNAKLYQLREKHPVVTFDGLIARISYTEESETPETAYDEYKAVGVCLTCEDCPWFRPALNMDGTEDRRAKWGGCQFSPFGYGHTKRTTKACEKLFEMIQNKEVRLCLRD